MNGIVINFVYHHIRDPPLLFELIVENPCLVVNSQPAANTHYLIAINPLFGWKSLRPRRISTTSNPL
jgi:hypothetical protein